MFSSLDVKMNWIPNPLVIEEPEILRTFYHLKFTSGYKSDCEFLKVLLIQFQQVTGVEVKQEILKECSLTENVVPFEMVDTFKSDLAVDCVLEQSMTSKSEQPGNIQPILKTDSAEESSESLNAGSSNSEIHLANDKMDIQYRKLRFPCHICGPSIHFKSSVMLKNHFKNHHFPSLPFKCNQCLYCFSDLLILKKHLCKVTIKELSECNECSKTFRANVDYDEHMERFHGEGERLLCGQCDRTYTSEWGLLHHTHKMHPGLDFVEDQIYLCYICTKCSFPNANELRGHFHSQHPMEKPFTCVSCNISFAGVKLLKMHAFKWRHFGYYNCEHCDAIYFKQESYLEHVEKVHGAKTKFFQALSTSQDSKIVSDQNLINSDGVIGPKHVCEICGKICSNQTKLNDHRTSHLGLTFTCPICNAKLPTKMSLTNHITSRHPTGDFPCKECNRVYKRAVSLRHHVTKEHSESGDKPPLPKFVCDLCGKVCVNKFMLLDHKETHQDNIRFDCHICKKQMSSRFCLKAHISYRHSDKPKKYVCEVCGNAYQIASALKSHSMVHDANRKRSFSCTKCGKTFLAKCHYKVHMENHDNLRKFVCEICSKGFNHRFALINHARIHTGERLFKCTMCSSDFPQSGSLYTHVKLKHKGKKISLKKLS